MEAALALPLCLGALLLMLCLFRALMLSQAVDNHLSMCARKSAAYSATHEGLKKTDVYRFFYEGIAENGLDTSMVAGGLAGIVLNVPEMGQEGGIIRVEAIYHVKVPGFIFSDRLLGARSSVSTRAWMGMEPGAGENERENEKRVFVTENAVVYHLSDECSYLKLSIKKVNANTIDSLRNMYGSRYTACERCVRAGNRSSVYITSQGNSWHSRRNCSGLKRSISTMTEEKAIEKGLSPCHRCGK